MEVKERNNNQKDFFKTQGEFYKKVNSNIENTWPEWKRDACAQNFAIRIMSK